MKILVIDDNEDDRLLYRRALGKGEDSLYEFYEAEDGDKGLIFLEQTDIACVLLDYSLPGRNGIETLKRIRSKHPLVPVVMLTGQGNEHVAVAAMQEGAQNYISKSGITPESLQRAIRVAVEHCAMQRRIHEQRASLEIFTRALAHDLKEPVRTIRSFVDLILENDALQQKTLDYFTYIRQAADRMNALIETVYFYTRLDGDGQISREPCDAAQLLREVRDNIARLIDERHAVIESGPLPEVSANRMQLAQLLQNLICNAIHHCDKPPRIGVSAEKMPQHWLFRVQDNGPGIAAEGRKKIFEPFRRLAHHKERGLGMGLAICKKIAELHGGKIWCESAPGNGTTFLFTLPDAQEATGAAALAASADQSPYADHTGALANLLLVDDSEADTALARIMLLRQAHLQCNFFTARDGREALERIQEFSGQKNPVDLMLLDINMPGMDGFELLEHMREEESLRNLAVVMCTTSTYDKDMERAKCLGAAGYLAKPVEFGKLRPIIDGIPTLRVHEGSSDRALLRAG